MMGYYKNGSEARTADGPLPGPLPPCVTNYVVPFPEPEPPESVTLDDIIDATVEAFKVRAQADLSDSSMRDALLLVSIEVHIRTSDPRAIDRAYAKSNGCKLCGAAFDCGTCASAATACHACGVGKCGVK